MDNKTVALYIRVSTDEQKREGLSIDAQINKLKEYCQFKKWDIFGEYIDEGISGSIPINKRPRGSKLMDDAFNGLFSTILIVKFDRAFRNTNDALQTLDIIKDNKIDFVSISEDIDTTTAMGKFFFTIISAFSELERGMTIDRNKAIMYDKFKRGLPCSRIPFGYIAVYSNKKEKKGVLGMDIYPKQAEVVKDCFLMASNGASYKSVCEKHKLKPQQFYNIIKNRVYCGYVGFDGEERKGVHEPIITEELWRKVNGN